MRTAIDRGQQALVVVLLALRHQQIRFAHSWIKIEADIRTTARIIGVEVGATLDAARRDRAVTVEVVKM